MIVKYVCVEYFVFYVQLFSVENHIVVMLRLVFMCLKLNYFCECEAKQELFK